MKRIVSIVIVLLIFSCGDSPTEPAGPDYPTTSVLSALFLGGWVPPDTSKGTSKDIQLTWTVCPDSSFSQYTLYRSYTPDIESLPDSAEILHFTFDASDTAYTDTNTEWDTWFYYAVKTSNQDTLVSWSNEASIYIPQRTSFGGPDSLVELVDVGAGPGGICPVPSGGYVYVACYFDNSVYVLETLDPAVFTSVSVNGGPMDVCAGSGYVYVSCSSGNEVTTIRTSDNTVESSVSVGDFPSGLCITPDGSRVYICCYGSDEVWCLDASSLAVLDVISVGDGPWDICTLPSGELVYLTNRLDGTVSVLRVSDNSVVSTLDTASEPVGICSSVSGDYVYVCDYTSNEVLPIRTSDNAVESGIDVGSGPMGIAVVPNGSLAYVSCYLDDRVYLVDLTIDSAVSYLPVGVRPNGVCILPSGEYLYVANSSSSTVSVFGYSNL